MKKTFLYLSMALLAGTLTFTSCSKKAKDESKEATEAMKDDIKDAANETGAGLKEAATDVKEGAQDVASDVKDAAKEVTTSADARLANLGKSARLEYDALEKEIARIDGEISSASASEKIKLQNTKNRLIEKRNALLN